MCNAIAYDYGVHLSINNKCWIKRDPFIESLLEMPWKRGERIPTNLIVGFLGSGKTTAITNLIEQRPDSEHWSIFVNEFGTVSIDHALVDSNTKEVAVEKLGGGCACCTMSFAFKPLLAQFIRRSKPDRLILEPSGISHPAKVVDILRSDDFSGAIDLRNIICLIDPNEFDEFFGIRNGFIDNFSHFFLHGKGYHDLYEGTTEVFLREQYFPQLITDRALAFIEKNQTTPFLLYLGFNIPHYPEQALPQHTALYQDLPMPRRSYAAITTTTDHYIGLVLEKLDKLKLTDNTIVIFQSDNGHSAENKAAINIDDHASGYPKGHYYSANGGGGNTGKWIGAKGSFLEGGIRVPAIVSWPAKLPQGIVRDQTVTIMDWLPSLMQWCEIDVPELQLDGRSLQPIIDSLEQPTSHPILHFQWQNKWAVREGNWKLIGVDHSDPSKNSLSLHNLGEPHPEVKDHARNRPGLTKKMLSMHREWANAVSPK